MGTDQSIVTEIASADGQPIYQPATLDEVLAVLIRLEQKVDTLAADMETTRESVAAIAKEAGPIINKLSTSPLVKMLGGKS